ncbi:MAG: Rdx family protein [Acidimicrobiales bacterium]|nr:Rdx family protein [Acidimicrobiales bacterium]
MSVAKDLLTSYQNVIADLTLITGENGVFDVVVDDAIIYSKTEMGRHAEPGEVLELFISYVGLNASRFGGDH